jgi:1-acyl-sn-glycerol-3-phosphate acyltransferase
MIAFQMHSSAGRFTLLGIRVRMPTPLDPRQKPGWTLDLRNPQVIRSFMPGLEWLYHHYFHVKTSGWHHIPTDQKVLLVGSHNGGLAAPDMFMMAYDWLLRFGPERPAYGLLHSQMWNILSPSLARLCAEGGCVQAHPKMAIAAFRRGASVLVYPGGAQDVFRPHSLRDRIFLGGNRAFIKLALREEVPIIPLISHGAHDTLIVLAEIYPLVKQLHEWGMPWLFGLDPVVFPIYLGWPWGISLGPLPNIPFPVQIHTRVCAPVVFDRYGADAAADRDYVDTCYYQVQNYMQTALNELIRECQQSDSTRSSAPS